MCSNLSRALNLHLSLLDLSFIGQTEPKIPCLVRKNDPVSQKVTSGNGLLGLGLGVEIKSVNYASEYLGSGSEEVGGEGSPTHLYFSLITDF